MLNMSPLLYGSYKLQVLVHAKGMGRGTTGGIELRAPAGSRACMLKKRARPSSHHCTLLHLRAPPLKEARTVVVTYRASAGVSGKTRAQEQTVRVSNPNRTCTALQQEQLKQPQLSHSEPKPQFH